jgi:hypothetical protein
VDAFVNGEGRMKGTMLGVFTVVNQKGEDLDNASLMRYLNEMTWFPEEFLRDYISWEEVDESSAIVHIEQFGKKDKATLKIDAEGRLLDFIAQRHSLEGKKLVQRTWRTPITSYREFDGMLLPYEGHALYEKEDGPESYIRARVTSVDHHVLKRMGT